MAGGRFEPPPAKRQHLALAQCLDLVFEVPVRVLLAEKSFQVGRRAQLLLYPQDGVRVCIWMEGELVQDIGLLWSVLPPGVLT